MATYSIAFWNLENLFTPENDPSRPEWLQKVVAKDLAGWTKKLFDKKIAQLAHGISQINRGEGPDLLGVCEVENAAALKALATKLQAKLPNRRYGVVHVDSAREQRGIDTAFLFDKNVWRSPNPKDVFSHFVMRRTGTRDITQCTFTTKDGRELVALANHWPSRSAPAGQGPEFSAGFRMTAGETLAYWHTRIREVKGEDVAVIALGDFNDDPFCPSLATHAVALREKGDVQRAESAKLYNLAWRYLTQDVVDHKGNPRTIDGSLYFGGNGNLFDQILVSPGLLTGKSKLRVRPETARIEAFAEMVDHRVGEGPIRFGLPKGDAAKNINEQGFSDHFPVSVLVATAGR